MTDKKNTESITFKVDKNTLAGMASIARDTGEYRSELIRRIINEYLLTAGRRWKKDYLKK
jgi:hypothetical protein